MKKILYFYLLTVLSLNLVSCNKEKKAAAQDDQLETYTIVPSQSTVQWTAYKTTDKLPVKGTFTEINVVKSEGGPSPDAALNGVEFEIPVSSIYSKDTIRDAKLNKFFFAVMENTLSLKGTFSIENETNGSIDLSMNGISKDLPFTYQMSKDTILIEAKMDLNIWNTQNALASLHEVCLELHTGPDGVSKTWDEVNISAKILTSKQ